MSNRLPPEGHDDNPEWTEADFARARPAAEVHAPHVVAALVRRGRPAGSISANPKQQITLRLDQDIVRSYRSTGPGWQGRINAALRKAAGL